MRMLATSLGVLFFVVAVTPSNAQTIIDSGTTLNSIIHDDIDIVAGSNPPTVVDVVSPASLRGLTRVFDASQLLITGGDTSVIEAYDSSVVNHTSGQPTSVLNTYDFSTAAVAGEINDLFTYDSSSVTLMDGAVGEIWSAQDASTLDIFAGRSDFLQSHDQSEANVFGGTFEPSARDDSAMNIFGGTIEFLWAGWPTDTHTAVVTVFGTGFNYPYGAIPDATGTLTGMLADGTPINSPFEIHSDASILLAVPEPGSLIALSMAAVMAISWLRPRRANV